MTFSTGLRAVAKAALRDAELLWEAPDTEDRENLSPANYDGDGEAFGFSFSELPSEVRERVDRDDAKDLYLIVFWARIEQLQES